MTQERYQEAAEECGRIAGIRQSYDQTDQADLMILARDILSKLASGWVLVEKTEFERLKNDRDQNN